MVRLLLIALAVLQAAPMPVRSVDKGAMSGISVARQVVVRGNSDWSALWHEHAPEKSQPVIDFSRETIVGVFLGTRPNAGFSVEITGFREDGGRTVVAYRETMPSPGAITAQVIVAPYHLVALPRRAGTIAFEKQPA